MFVLYFGKVSFWSFVVFGVGGSYRYRGLVVERIRVRRRSRRDGWGWGQLAVEDFWFFRLDSLGRAWVSVVRELEFFLLIFRS